MCWRPWRFLGGFDWFNYPHESVYIEQVYPEPWNWLTTGSIYTFSEFYDGFDAPKNACAACYNGLYKATTPRSVADAKSCQN